MKHLKRFALRLLAVLCIYGFFAVGLPYFIALTSSNGFKDEQLTKVESLGRFTYGQFSTVSYELRGNGETVVETSLMSFVFSKNLTIQTMRQEGGAYTIVYTIEYVRSGNQLYQETLRSHPEILTEAERVLQLGRDSFAKTKKKLEHRPNHNQPARLG